MIKKLSTYNFSKNISKIIKNFNNILNFAIVDDIFVIKKSLVEKFCNKVNDLNNISLKFHCFTHAGHGDENLYRKMSLAGFNKISMGGEHGNNKVLKICGKNTNRSQIEKTCKDIYKAGIKLNLLYILGNIKETNKTISETVDFAIYLHKKYNASSYFSYMQPLPGSDIYKIASEFGKYLIENRNFRNNRLCYLPSGVTRNHIINEMKRGKIMANYNGSLKNYRSIIFLYFIFYERKFN